MLNSGREWDWMDNHSKNKTKMSKEEIIQDLKQENIKLKEELELVKEELELVKKKLRREEQDVFRLAVEKIMLQKQIDEQEN